MAMNLKEIESMIKEALPDAIIDIQDLAGDGNHYSATITSSAFNGKSKIEQHKMIYNSLKGKMGNELHALALKTSTMLKVLNQKKYDEVPEQMQRWNKSAGVVNKGLVKRRGAEALLFASKAWT